MSLTQYPAFQRLAGSLAGRITATPFFVLGQMQRCKCLSSAELSTQREHSFFQPANTPNRHNRCNHCNSQPLPGSYEDNATTPAAKRHSHSQPLPGKCQGPINTMLPHPLQFRHRPPTPAHPCPHLPYVPLCAACSESAAPSRAEGPHVDPFGSCMRK